MGIALICLCCQHAGLRDRDYRPSELERSIFMSYYGFDEIMFGVETKEEQEGNIEASGKGQSSQFEVDCGKLSHTDLSCIRLSPELPLGVNAFDMAWPHTVGVTRVMVRHVG